MFAESAIHIQRKYTILESVAFRTSQRTVRFMEHRRYSECAQAVLCSPRNLTIIQLFE